MEVDRSPATGRTLNHVGHGVPPGINLTGVTMFFAANVSGGVGPLTVELLSGGRSNLTYRIVGPDGEWVLRRPPLGHILPTAHDMAREYRVLTALSAVGAPVPATFALCDDASVTGAPFYVMEFRRGLVMGEEFEDVGPPDEISRTTLSRSVVDALVQLHAVDYEAVGLGDFGRPAGYLERQIRRWVEQWDRSKTREVAALKPLVAALRTGLPQSPAPTVVHGDFRLGNIVVKTDPWSVDAILDWEMATLGDPLADLGWLLMSWGQADDSEEELDLLRMGGTFQTGYWNRGQLAAEYGRLSGRDVSAANWYESFAHFKRAVVIEGIHNRYLQGLTVGPGFERYGHAPFCMEYALHLLST